VALAAERAVVRLGAQDVRVIDVASEAGLSAAAVLYYYPSRAELIRVAFERAFDRFVAHRKAVAAAIDDPAERLVAVLREGFPSGPDDEEVVGLYTGVQAIRDDPELAALVRNVTDRQVELYRNLLESGAVSGAFTLAGDAAMLARNLVALEDAYGLYAVGAGIPAGEGLRLTLAFAELAVGRSLS
jgi:AcrR family transcriptional regulator